MIVAWLAGLFRTGKNNPTLLLLIVFVVYFFITQYQSRLQDKRIISLAEQNITYVQRLEAEQLEAKEMRTKIYDMQQELHKLTVYKNTLTKDYQSKLLMISNELQNSTCANVTLPDNLVKWLQLNPDANKTASNNK
ncbi:hypothetical protein [Psittacicella hinzii]|uniref:DUF2570 domain-containing protein n=1 Tax=Psittacicella hinzii TaxID=2028575 RepID=A0A3A1YFE8_9GAMM|nr:hypothetical protein [Psittacicella hinzii]RIY36009.1 hypothetical protein CKF58_06380 [Psittacicella hinzii]